MKIDFSIISPLRSTILQCLNLENNSNKYINFQQYYYNFINKAPLHTHQIKYYLK